MNEPNEVLQIEALLLTSWISNATQYPFCSTCAHSH